MVPWVGEQKLNRARGERALRARVQDICLQWLSEQRGLRWVKELKGGAKWCGTLRTRSGCSEQAEKGSVDTKLRDRILSRSGTFTHSKRVTKSRLLSRAQVGMDGSSLRGHSAPTPCLVLLQALGVQQWTREVEPCFQGAYTPAAGRVRGRGEGSRDRQF